MSDRPGMPGALTPGSDLESEPLTIEEVVEQQKAQERAHAVEQFGPEKKESAPEPKPEAAPEATPEQQPQRETGKEQEGAREQERKETAAAKEGEDKTKRKAPAASQLPKDMDDDLFLKTFLTQDQPEQVKGLVVIAFKKGIRHAVELASSAKSPYLLDAFHDALIDELYTHLVDKKKLPKA